MPQGLQVGPILCSFFMCVYYLDLYAVITSMESCVTLHDLNCCCQVNNLKLHVTKCKIIHFHCKYLRIKHDNMLNDVIVFWTLFCPSDLGVNFDEILSSREYVNKVVMKGYRLIGVLDQMH